MIVKDVSFLKPEENILFDEVLLDLAEKGEAGEAIRFWESPVTFIVLGRISKLADDVLTEHAREDKIPVLRRSSGGGTVVQGQGCFNYSFILSKEKHPVLISLKDSYQFILNRVCEALLACGVTPSFEPISDLAVGPNRKKISGNAQKRGKKFILHHGTILYDFPLNLIERYLKFPKEVPWYRRGRRHQDFVSNVPIVLEDFKRYLCKSFDAAEEAKVLSQKEKDQLAYFLKTREVFALKL